MTWDASLKKTPEQNKQLTTKKTTQTTKKNPNNSKSFKCPFLIYRICPVF